MSHPAQYSREVLVVLRWLLPNKTRVHDPFAGPGTRLGHLADERGLIFSGTEIEPGFIVDKRVKQGDATDPTTYPPPFVDDNGNEVLVGQAGWCAPADPLYDIMPPPTPLRGYTICTSPVYPNGMADHFQSRTDKSNHRTYRHGLAKLTGDPEVELHTRNMGRWGYRGRSLSSPARLMYWNLARQAVACWTGAERVLLNVSDFNAGGITVPVVEGWLHIMEANGWQMGELHKVRTPRYRNGQNSAERVEYEVVIEFGR